MHKTHRLYILFSQTNEFPLSYEDYIYYYQGLLKKSEDQPLAILYPSFKFLENYTQKDNACITLYYPDKKKISEIMIKATAFLTPLPSFIPKIFATNSKGNEEYSYPIFWIIAFLNFISYYLQGIFQKNEYFQLEITYFNIHLFKMNKFTHLQKTIFLSLSENPLIEKDIHSEFVHPESPKIQLFPNHDIEMPASLQYLSAWSVFTSLQDDKDFLEDYLKKFPIDISAPSFEKNSKETTPIEADINTYNELKKNAKNFIEITLCLKKNTKSYIDRSPLNKQQISKPIAKDQFYNSDPEKLIQPRRSKLILKSELKKNIERLSSVIKTIQSFKIPGKTYNKIKQSRFQ